ncbi:glycoside hydrolase family 75 protein [Streptomyces sp. NPDC020681]|uniref:glycoside hydrolase family 75 protein n=1 Tax=Streptomyces sp. NPDC020681 TaxID=3365083 RepID=UPI00379E73B9
MRIRHAVFTVAAGSALLAAAVLPAAAHAHHRATAPTSPAEREGSVTASELLAKVKSCTQISAGRYRSDSGTSANIPVCKTGEAVFWKADMDIDCDGQRTTHCSVTTDPWFQNTTAFQQSDGKQLNAETLPFIVVPTPSSVWDYRTQRIMGGTVVAVIYNNQVQYAVVGDTGPSAIIGEASYATAKALGINPDPRTGGVASGVTYILFTNTRVSPIESHSGAVMLGEALAKEFVRTP